AHGDGFGGAQIAVVGHGRHAPPERGSCVPARRLRGGWLAPDSLVARLCLGRGGAAGGAGPGGGARGAVAGTQAGKGLRTVRVLHGPDGGAAVPRVRTGGSGGGGAVRGAAEEVGVGSGRVPAGDRGAGPGLGAGSDARLARVDAH